VMEKLIQMIVSLKMRVSQNGLKVNVTKLKALAQIAPPSSGVFYFWNNG